MKRLWLPILASAALLSSLPLAASAGTPPNAAQMAPLHYLLGTWHCAWKSEGQTGNEDQIFATALDGAWLEEKEVVQNASGQPFVQSIHYTGYDPQNKRYMHVGPDANGSYEIAESPDSNVWRNPGTNNVFIHTKVSDTERTLSETDHVNGKAISLTMTCTK